MNILGWIFVVLAIALFAVGQKFWQIEAIALSGSAACGILAWSSFATSKDVG